jgi:hypothetical protein
MIKCHNDTFLRYLANQLLANDINLMVFNLIGVWFMARRWPLFKGMMTVTQYEIFVKLPQAMAFDLLVEIPILARLLDIRVGVTVAITLWFRF